MSRREPDVYDVIEAIDAVRDVQPSRRERIATAVLCGVILSPDESAGTIASATRFAVKCADALIAELDK